MLFSLSTVFGVLLHDTYIDRAFMTVNKSVETDSSFKPEVAIRLRSNSSLHPHTEGLNVHEADDNDRDIPRNRNRKSTGSNRRTINGYHGDDYCLPLVGEWF